MELLVLEWGELPCGDLQEGVVMAFTYTEDPRKEEAYEPEEPMCPVCGSVKCDYFYKKHGEIIGCDDCIRREDVYGYDG